jgi:hypothetical protein
MSRICAAGSVGFGGWVCRASRRVVVSLLAGTGRVAPMENYVIAGWGST